jgi:uncharacterized protein (TIGR04255 family)
MNVYYSVAKPSGLRYIGLRYINRIEIKPDQNLDSVFNIGFKIPDEFRSFPDPYLLRMEFTYHDDRDKLIIILATAQPQEGSQNAAMLDFEYILIEPDKIEDEFLDWMDEAHGRIEDAFHACLTESVLESFEPSKTSAAG